MHKGPYFYSRPGESSHFRMLEQINSPHFNYHLMSSGFSLSPIGYFALHWHLASWIQTFGGNKQYHPLLFAQVSSSLKCPLTNMGYWYHKIQLYDHMINVSYQTFAAVDSKCDTLTMNWMRLNLYMEPEIIYLCTVGYSPKIGTGRWHELIYLMLFKSIILKNNQANQYCSFL